MNLLELYKKGFIKDGGHNVNVPITKANGDKYVGEFLNDKIGFYDIPYYIERTLEQHKNRINPTIEDILEVDKETRAFLANLLK